jgi:anthranilate/para-aminobenzoate synthase component I
VAIPDDAAWGATWADVPVGAALVQLDYEFPRAAPLVIPATHLARWDAAGRCTLHGDDPARLAAMAARLAAFPAASAPPPARLLAPLVPAWNAASHQARVERIRALIASGDCYQANLAVPFRGRLAPGPHRDIACMRRLLAGSPAPYAAFLRAPGRPSVVSHSPECLLAVRGERLCSVPIKGTRRRVPGRDAESRAELRAAPKDRAELAMIVDLVRNDLGRVAVAGSVRVADPDLLMDLPYVHHRAARIEARRRPGATVADALLAAFPAGSITGAPKIRAMEILADLEGAPRGAYCGAFGWLGADAADLAVAIRTAEVAGDAVTLRAGGGIVWDSDGAAEWDEVLAKAAGLAETLR